MYLEKIKSEDLLFTNEIEDDRINTYLNLADYDWMNYTLTTRFKTEKMGVLNVKFEYFGMVTSAMEVEKILNDKTETVVYEYSTDIFQKYIVKFMEKHIRYWNEKYAFNGEEEVIEFFNEVLDKGTVREKLAMNGQFYSEKRGVKVSLPEKFYEEMDKMFDELGIELEDTDDKEKIINANNFIATFTPSEPIIIE